MPVGAREVADQGEDGAAVVGFGTERQRCRLKVVAARRDDLGMRVPADKRSNEARIGWLEQQGRAHCSPSTTVDAAA